MKDIHGHSSPPLKVKGHRNSEVLRAHLTSAETLEEPILSEPVVMNDMRQSQSSLSLQAAMQALNYHNLMSNDTKKTPGT